MIHNDADVIANSEELQEQKYLGLHCLLKTVSLKTQLWYYIIYVLAVIFLTIKATAVFGIVPKAKKYVFSPSLNLI